MKWLRKKIIDWIFGANFVSYEDLYNTYVETANDYMKHLDKEMEVIDSANRLIKINEELLHENKVYVVTLKENGIDLSKIDFNKEV